MCVLPSRGFRLGFLSLSLLFHLAASNPCIPANNGTYFAISTQADIDPLINCRQINYPLFIYDFPGSLSLPNLVEVAHLYIDYNASITSLSLPHLITIQPGGINFLGPNLTTLDLPLLYDANGIAVSCPSLNSWSGTNSLESTMNLQIFQHNISALSFANLNNVSWPLLFNFSSPGGSLYLNGSAEVDALITGYNDTDFTSDMPNIESMVVRGCANIDINSKSMEVLEVSMNPNLVNLRVLNLSSLGPYVYYGTSILPGVTPARNDVLLIAENPSLKNIYFPSLTKIGGGLQIMENMYLQELGTAPGDDSVGFGPVFPALRTVAYDILINGSIQSLYFPGLTYVGGSIVLDSTSDDYSCSYLQSLFDSGIVHGNFYCQTPLAEVNSTVSAIPTSSKHKSGLDKPELIGISIGVIVFGFCISGLFTWWMVKNRGWSRPPRRSVAPQHVPQ